MKVKHIIVLLLITTGYRSYAQQDPNIDAVKTILNARYQVLAQVMDERNLDKIMNFRTADFHAIGPDGKVMDHLMMKEYSRQFITNNIPPYNITNTILNLSVSDNNIVAVAEVLQEVVRTRNLAGKIREVRTSAVQTETWVISNNQWKLKSVENVHDQKRYIDGKRVDPTKPYDPDAPAFDPK